MMHQLLIEQRSIDNQMKVVVMPGVCRRPTVLRQGAALLMRAKRINNDPGLRQRIAVLENCLAKSVEEKQALEHQLNALNLQLISEKKDFSPDDCEKICLQVNGGDPNFSCSVTKSESGVDENRKSRFLWNETAAVKQEDNIVLHTLEQQKVSLQKKLEEAFSERQYLHERLRNEMANEQKELQSQLDEYRRQLDTCEGRLRNVTEENEHIKQSEETLRSQIDKAQNKETGLLTQMRDLQQKHNEIQMCVADQNKQLQDKTDVIKKLETTKMDLEQQLESEQLDHRLLQARYAALQMERDNHLQQLRLTLEEAAREKRELHEKFDKEFEYLRNRNSERDHQLMDDYEWKLREIERDYKAKMDSERKKHQDAMDKSKENLEKQLDSERLLWNETKDALTSQLEELRQHRERKDRSSESELKQLRGLTQELQNKIKSSTSQVDESRLARDLLQDELDKLEIRYESSKRQISKLQSEICDIKDLHSERMKTLRDQTKRQVEESRTDCEGYWKDHYRDEYAKWQVALEKEFEDEKQFSLETLQTRKNAEMAELQLEHEQQVAELDLEVQSLQEVNTSLTSKLKEVELEYESRISLLDTKLTEKMDEVKKDKVQAEELVQQTKADLEKDKHEQIARHNDELEKCKENHRIALEELEKRYTEKNQQALDESRSQMESERKRALEEVMKIHRNNLQMMRQEFDKALMVIKQKDKYIKDLEKEFHYRELQTHELQLTSENLEKRLKEMELHQQTGDLTLTSQHNPESSSCRLSDSSPGCGRLVSCCPRPSPARPKAPPQKKREPSSRSTPEAKRELNSKQRNNEPVNVEDDMPTPMRRKVRPKWFIKLVTV